MNILTHLVITILACGLSLTSWVKGIKAQDKTQPRLVGTALALSIFLLATGCNPTNDIVTIHYEQIGACNGFNNGGGITSAGPKAAYVVFRISTIENNDTAARDFNFDPNRIYINLSPQAFTSTQLNLSQLNPFYARARFVPKGTTAPANVGAVIAIVSTSAEDGASEANKTSYLLSYDLPSGGQGVIFVKANSSQTTWPSTPDCTDIVY
jgi:hypothetical protein